MGRKDEGSRPLGVGDTQRSFFASRRTRWKPTTTSTRREVVFCSKQDGRQDTGQAPYAEVRLVQTR